MTETGLYRKCERMELKFYILSSFMILSVLHHVNNMGTFHINNHVVLNSGLKMSASILTCM